MQKQTQRLIERGQWLWRRLSCMSPAEVGYRCRQAALTRLLRHGLLPTAAPDAARPERAAPAAVAPDGLDAAPYLREADAILAGRVLLFAASSFEVGARPEWNRDPLTGIVGPRGFAHAIAITDRARVGDIKHVWELNRHLHLVRLAQAYALSGTPRYADGLRTQLRDWLDQCPPMTGCNWTSSLELAIRLINWSLIWQWVGGADGALFVGPEGLRLRADWLDSIYAHSRAIERHLSRHSSANNHLIGELAGLYVAACTWPCWQRSAAWARQAKTELEAEARKQHAADGVNREQAFSYQVFSAEFLIVAALAGGRVDQHFSVGYWDILRRGIDFVLALRDVGGHLPMVGDADDGIVFRLEPGPVQDRPGLLLALGAALFGESAAAPPDSVRWLGAASAATSAAAVSAMDITSTAHAGLAWDFSAGGYLLFGTRFGQSDEIKGLLDCGPLGYLGIAAHGHADALALTLSVCGEPCMVDPGTYSYWQDIVWRDYFRGTSAHNTVRVDGLDQSVSGGRFMWTRKAVVIVERHPEGPEQFEFEGSHDGYLRLPDPVRHRRAVRFDAEQSSLTVTDTLVAGSRHRVEQFWHFAPAMEVALDGGVLRVRGRRFALEGRFTGAGLRLELLRGEENPPLGWYSAAYESKEPCTVLRISTTEIDQSIEARFRMCFIKNVT